MSGASPVEQMKRTTDSPYVFSLRTAPTNYAPCFATQSIKQKSVAHLLSKARARTVVDAGSFITETRRPRRRAPWAPW